MPIHLTPEQEQRIQAVVRQGAYDSVDEVVEAAEDDSLQVIRILHGSRDIQPILESE